jgi:hypothetical protein
MKAHREILDEIHEIYKAKNADYGNSFSDSVEEFGLVAAIVRIGDKMNRLKTLVRLDQQYVKDESMRDTLLDLAGYAVMTIMELDNKIYDMNLCHGNDGKECEVPCRYNHDNFCRKEN